MDEKRYLQSLISEGEHQQQDLGYRGSDALKLAKSVSAFANPLSKVFGKIERFSEDMRL